MTQTDPAQILRPLRRVRQVREFTDAPVTQAALDAIADVGRWSGSSQNGQPWRFIVVRDVGLVRRLGAMDMPSSHALSTAMGAIVIVLRAGDGRSDAFDEGRAAERMLIAASELGLAGGLVWVSPAARAAVAGALGVPDGWVPTSALAVGHPTPAALVPKSPAGQARLPRSRTVSVDRWGHEQAR
ncbi:MAG: nitroreductase family protein [Chloroflexota bacterium]